MSTRDPWIARVTMHALSDAYGRWSTVAETALGYVTPEGTSVLFHSNDRVAIADAEERAAGSADPWVGCLWALLADDSSSDADLLFRARSARSALTWSAFPLWQERIDALTVRADEMQSVGDERGKWITLWLTSPLDTITQPMHVESTAIIEQLRVRTRARADQARRRA